MERFSESCSRTSIVGEVYGARYVYRADGMRVEKVEGLTLSWVPPGEEEVSGHYDENLAQNLPTIRYYYDGQMMVEDDYTVEGQNEPVVTVMRYGIGARGIDFLAKSVDGGAETVGFPLYDGHGNMIATLGRSESSPYFGVADLRSYDVWGSVRSGSTTGDPKQRYCANLGHVQDDESGLIYMRARYYEPWSGRFISEDAAGHGLNWFVYATNSPANKVDSAGYWTDDDVDAYWSLIGAIEGLAGSLWAIVQLSRKSAAAALYALASVSFLMQWADIGPNSVRPSDAAETLFIPIAAGFLHMAFAALLQSVLRPNITPSGFQHGLAVLGVYLATLTAFMFLREIEDGLSYWY